MSDARHLPLVIVGSGPAALTAAIYAARAGHAPVLIAGTVPGGDLTTTSEVENFPSFPEGIDGGELVSRMSEHAERFGAVIEEDVVLSIDVAAQSLTTYAGTVTYDAVIWATGSEHRKLGLSNEEQLVGAGVSYCATCDGAFFKGEHVVVVGGGDSAVEEALYLSKHASAVTLLVRGDEFRASKVMAERALAHPSIDVRFSTAVDGIVERNGRVAGVTVSDAGGTHDIDATGLFVAIGSDPRTDLVSGQVSLRDGGYIVTEGRAASVPGIGFDTPGFFAAGDVIDPVYRQAVTAAGSGAVAGIDAAGYLDSLG